MIQWVGSILDLLTTWKIFLNHLWTNVNSIHAAHVKIHRLLLIKQLGLTGIRQCRNYWWEIIHWRDLWYILIHSNFISNAHARVHMLIFNWFVTQLPVGDIGKPVVDTGEARARGAWLFLGRGDGGGARFCGESAAAAGLRCGTKEIRVQHEP